MLNRPASACLALLAPAAVLWPQAVQAAVLNTLSSSFGFGAAAVSLAAARHGAAPLGGMAAGALALASLAWLRRRRERRDGEVPPVAEHAVLAMARERFVRLQSAWDRGDVDTLRALTTDGMLDELLDQLPERGALPNRTDVLSLDARLLGLDRLEMLELACVEFSGMVRESPDRQAAPFREIWMLTRQPGEADWRLARQQALL